jgi:hypothetical protein
MYQLIKSPFISETTQVLRVADSAFIPFDPDNTDYQEYLKWVAEGGVVLSADEPASQPVDGV